MQDHHNDNIECSIEISLLVCLLLVDGTYGMGWECVCVFILHSTSVVWIGLATAASFHHARRHLLWRVMEDLHNSD